MNSRRILRLGTRGSKLARWQAEWVASELRRFGHAVELVEIATRGDVEGGRAIEQIGTRGVFTKEIQRALLNSEIDVGVHSLKDLPTESVIGLTIAAVPMRESAADVLVSGASTTLVNLPHGARIGTGSLRRQAQLRYVRPDFRCQDVRGNVDTRLRKLDEGQFDGIVLAEAGLRRLGLGDRISQVLSYEVMLPAVGQGALAIECRDDDTETLTVVTPLEHGPSRAAVTAERALLAHLRGGCMAPVGAFGWIAEDVLYLSAAVLSADGKQRLTARDSASSTEAESLGKRLAEALLKKGAAELIEASRRHP